jgi:bifunctional non-homologous end joining protein LigD
VPFAQVIEGARVVHAALRSLGLASFLKTTGGAGLHVVVPLVPHAEWDACLAFARAFAETIVRSSPEAYTTDFAKHGRERKILVDYLRNNRTNTSVSAFSTRAKPGAPVSMPLAWRDLGTTLDPSDFTVFTVPKRLAKLRTDPWAGYWSARQKLGRAVLKAVGL